MLAVGHRSQVVMMDALSQLQQDINARKAIVACRWCGNTDREQLKRSVICDPPWLCRRCYAGWEKIPIRERIKALPPTKPIPAPLPKPKPPKPEGIYRRASKAVRQAAIAAYGGKCQWCQTTLRLEFDHINNDGAAHRRQLDGMPLEEWLQQEGYPQDIVRLLCRSCHELKTHGHVSPKTAQQRLVHSLIRRVPLMPPRQGASTVHITLAPDANKILDELADLDPSKSKSRIVEGLIRQTTANGNGHQVDLLAGLEVRLERAADDVETLTNTLATLTPTLATLKGTIDRLELQQKNIIDALNAIYDEQQRVRKAALVPWWTLAFRWLRYGSVSSRVP